MLCRPAQEHLIARSAGGRFDFEAARSRQPPVSVSPIARWLHSLGTPVRKGQEEAVNPAISTDGTDKSGRARTPRLC